MSYRVRYTPQAEAKLLNWTHWRTAGDIDAELLRFAGANAPTRDARALFVIDLRVADHRAVVAVDRVEKVVRVLRIYRAR
jgi:hypothetical protein